MQPIVYAYTGWAVISCLWALVDPILVGVSAAAGAYWLTVNFTDKLNLRR